LISARWRPNTFSSASEISPTVALARAASIASAKQVAVAAAGVARQRRQRASTSFWSRSALQPRQLVDLQLRTAELSTLSTSIGASFDG
jgi:hypothetical protein